MAIQEATAQDVLARMAVVALALAGSGAGYMAGGTKGAIAVPAAGYAAKKISDALTARRAGLADPG